MAIDCLVIGGGVIGLTAAWALAEQGLTVRVLDQGEPGREASWAGAGILPPALLGQDLLSSLIDQANARWPEMSRELLEVTGVDNEFHRCGAIELRDCPADQPEDPEGTRREQSHWQAAGARAIWLSADEVRQQEPALSGQESGILLPDLCQVRNPRHMRALLGACVRAGVEISPHQGVVQWQRMGTRVTAAVTATGKVAAGAFVVTAGAWSGRLLAEAGGSLSEVVPVRGQIVLLQAPVGTLSRVIERGKRYLVPRRDGQILIGSTEEWVGFEKANTPECVQDLLDFAERIIPGITRYPLQKTWSGLRPAAVRGRPLIGKIPGWDNLHVATGHFRTGLQLSPVTAEMVCQSVLGPGCDSRFCP